MDEAARQERKLNVWRRVKNALDRWAQLRRMTRYGLAWLAEAARTSTADNEKFEEKYGYSYEYVIIFPNETEDTGWKNNQLGFLFDTPDSMQRKKKGGPEEISKKDQINAAIKALKDCGIETKQYPSVQVCAISRPRIIVPHHSCHCKALTRRLTAPPSALVLKTPLHFLLNSSPRKMKFY